jgi:hypothetical protein
MINRDNDAFYWGAYRRVVSTDILRNGLDIGYQYFRAYSDKPTNLILVHRSGLYWTDSKLRHNTRPWTSGNYLEVVIAMDFWLDRAAISGHKEDFEHTRGNLDQILVQGPEDFKTWISLASRRG